MVTQSAKKAAAASGPQWPNDPAGSPKEWGLTAAGELCETSDPKVLKMLVSRGGFIPWADAARYGLVETGELPVAGDRLPEEGVESRDGYRYNGEAAALQPPPDRVGDLELKRNRRPARKAKKKS